MEIVGQAVVGHDSGDKITVNGVELEATGSLGSLRTACAFFGISQSGSKVKCYRRLWQHAQKLQLQNTLTAANGARAQMEREVLAPPLAQPPNELEQQKHFLTRTPYAQWCEHCVAFRARQDRHPRDDSSKMDSTPTISFDYCYAKDFQVMLMQLRCCYG